jgi:hypothetical protein
MSEHVLVKPVIARRHWCPTRCRNCALKPSDMGLMMLAYLAEPAWCPKQRALVDKVVVGVCGEGKGVQGRREM